MSRLSWDEYALKLAQTAALRSEDPYVKVGACTLRHDNSVAGLGYNGAPAGVNIDWSERDNRRKFVVHAEINCLRYTKPNECRVLACTMAPCVDCLRTIAANGITKVLFYDFYGEDRSVFELAPVFGIALIQHFKYD